MISISSLSKIALVEARKSDNRFRLGAVIYTKNTILSRDHNYSLKSTRNLHPKFRSWPGSVHAEMAAILSARTDLSGSTLFIVRINRKEEFLLSKPCSHCIKYIIHTGIKKVIYSTGMGFNVIDLKFKID